MGRIVIAGVRLLPVVYSLTIEIIVSGKQRRMSSMNDLQKLIKRALSGNERAWRELIGAVVTLVEPMAKRILAGVPDCDADDAIEHVLLTILKDRDEPQPKGAGWIVVVAKRWCIDQKRKQRVRVAVASNENDVPDEIDDVSW